MHRWKVVTVIPQKPHGYRRHTHQDGMPRHDRDGNETENQYDA